MDTVNVIMAILMMDKIILVRVVIIVGKIILGFYFIIVHIKQAIITVAQYKMIKLLALFVMALKKEFQ